MMYFSVTQQVMPLGAFIARSYGGAEVMQRIVQNNKTDSSAVTEAIASLGYSDDFPLLLQKWGDAVLLSDIVDTTPEAYTYNSGAYFTSTIPSTGTNYNLGSINMFNYSASSQNGPYMFSDNNPIWTKLSNSNKNSNIFYQVGLGVSGIVTRTINMPAGTRLTIITK